MEQHQEHIDAATGLLKGSFGIGTYSDGGTRFPGLVRADGGVIDLSFAFADTHAIFDDWERNFGRLVDIAANGTANHQFSDLHALPPLAHPNLLCAGSNYKQHVAEMLTKNAFYQHMRTPGESDESFFARNYASVELRAREGTPFIWTGVHSSLAGAGDDLLLPHVGEQHDWELELGVVLARGERNVRPEDAGGLIAGYVMVNDLGSVDTFRREDIHFNYDWIGKHQPGFKIAGPFIVPSQFIKLGDDVRIKLRVNGEIMQDWPCSDMIFSAEQLVAYASERFRLLPGDILITGSPPGNGAHHGRFLHAGDMMDGEITYLGRQRNRCLVEELHGRKPTFGMPKKLNLSSQS